MQIVSSISPFIVSMWLRMHLSYPHSSNEISLAVKWDRFALVSDHSEIRDKGEADELAKKTSASYIGTK